MATQAKKFETSSFGVSPTPDCNNERQAKRRCLNYSELITTPQDVIENLYEGPTCSSSSYSQRVLFQETSFTETSETQMSIFSRPSSDESFNSDQDEKTQSNLTLSLKIRLTDTTGNALVCFGMFTLGCTCAYVSDRTSTSPCIPVEVINSSKLMRASDSALLGNLNTQSAKILAAISAAEGIEVEMFCLNKDELYNPPKRNMSGTRKSVHLFVILYGTMDYFEQIGDFFQKCAIYLQDPLHCTRNVPYRNPHRLSGLDDEVRFTLGNHRSEPVDIENIEDQRDSFAELEILGSGVETEGPQTLRTRLLTHQKQALTFMLRREKGWALHNFDQPDVWKAKSLPDGRDYYTNTITGEQQYFPPPSFNGGILADPMGLGKSLSIISLIASDTLGTHQKQRDDDSSKTTLLVVPSPLLQTWDDELLIHLHPNALLWAKYHGTRRSSILERVQDYDLVITTYGTLSADWKVWKGREKRSLFDIPWHRVVLDEAHTIRDRTTMTAQAACSLEANRRWAITGTPLQNRLTDLGSLFKFLQAYPFSDPTYFGKFIKKPADTDFDPNNMSKLICFMRCIGLRRPKSVIDLPSRRNEVHYVEFSEEEMATYEKVLRSTSRALKETATGKGLDRNLYLHILAWINSLRMICNLGVCYQKPSDAEMDPSSWDQGMAQRTFEDMYASGTAICAVCSVDLGSDAYERPETEPLDLRSPFLSQCVRVVCGICLKAESWADQGIAVCKEHPKCRFFPVSSTTTTTGRVGSWDNFSDPPTKLKALLDGLKSVPSDEKSLVFSFWTSTLDMVEKLLRYQGTLFVRIDGKVNQKDRNAAINSFRTNPKLRVMLISISCGAVGLDLTVASRVFLMEPQWNPMVEEQALDRVHRIGQTKQVVTVRYIVRGSFEENIRKIQTGKRHLADVCFSSSRSAYTDQLQHFRDLIGIEKH